MHRAIRHLNLVEILIIVLLPDKSLDMAEGSGLLLWRPSSLFFFVLLLFIFRVRRCRVRLSEIRTLLKRQLRPKKSALLPHCPSTNFETNYSEIAAPENLA